MLSPPAPVMEVRFNVESVEMDCFEGHKFSKRCFSSIQFTPGPALPALFKIALCFITVTSTNAHFPSVAKSPFVVTSPKSKIVRVISEPNPVLSGQVTRTCASYSDFVSMLTKSSLSCSTDR